VPYATAGGHRLHYEWIGPGPEEAPTLVVMHQALGCVETWGDFPARLAAATGCGALVYSRWGSGKSDPIGLDPRPPTYMEDEAWVALPDLLAATGVRQVIPVGHSDGGTIALFYAADPKPVAPLAVVSVAAHVFYDEHSRGGLAQTRVDWDESDLRARLARHHGDNTDGMYLSWTGLWLKPESLTWNVEHTLPAIVCPALVMQGSEDAHGVVGQVDAIVRGVSGPAERVIMDGVGHEPHREAPQETLRIMAGFIERARARKAAE